MLYNSFCCVSSRSLLAVIETHPIWSKVSMVVTETKLLVWHQIGILVYQVTFVRISFLFQVKSYIWQRDGKSKASEQSLHKGSNDRTVMTRLYSLILRSSLSGTLLHWDNNNCRIMRNFSKSKGSILFSSEFSNQKGESK
jgi:hypothetical protein